MKYSPVIFWLLLAATIAVDALAIAWVAQAGPLSAATFLYDALVSAQLAIVCLWAVFSAERAIWSWAAVILAVIVATLSTVQLDLLSFGEACGIYGSFAATLAVALWMLKRSARWQRLTNAPATAWQFSLAHLLAAMTLVAVLIVALRTSPLVSTTVDLWRFLTVLTLGDVLVVVATLVLWATPRHWLARLATVAAAAMLLGAMETAGGAWGLLGESVMTSFADDPVPLVAYTTLMSLVVFAWLELVPLVPHARRAAALPPAGADGSSPNPGA